jgi:hypothetical protein
VRLTPTTGDTYEPSRSPRPLIDTCRTHEAHHQAPWLCRRPGVRGALIPGVASADPTEFIYPAGELCAFAVGITPFGAQKFHDLGRATSSPPEGSQRPVTNKQTGATKSYNISCPTLGRGEVPTAVTGPNLILQPASRNVGPAFLIYTTGRVTFTPDFTIASRTGRVTDVCAALS